MLLQIIIDLSEHLNLTTIFAIISSVGVSVGGTYLAYSKWRINTDNKMVIIEKDIQKLQDTTSKFDTLNSNLRLLERDVQYLKLSNNSLTEKIDIISKHTHSIKGEMAALSLYFKQLLDKND